MKRYQFVWWGWFRWRFNRRKPFRNGMAKIYRWTLSIGPLEIRRWV